MILRFVIQHYLGSWIVLESTIIILLEELRNMAAFRALFQNFVELVLIFLRYSDVGESLSGKVQVSFSVFTNNWFFMMASNIMPFNSISVKVVQNSHTGFFFSVLLNLFTVVGLAAGRLESAKKRLENEAWRGTHFVGMCPPFIKTCSRMKELTP